MSIFNGLNINASGLALERLKLDTISTNIANVNTHQTEGREAYRRKTVEFTESLKNAQQTQTNQINGITKRLASPKDRAPGKQEVIIVQ